ncbi:MAG: PPOX class F420-dependent oxidoreductase [Actinobacteria bacterium]|nr:PPOX class F420-dependent oxidoreductase [Actinomycetota bacterium]
MDAGEARHFVAAHPKAVLITLRRSGRPQASPVLAAVDDEGRVVISTRDTAAKTRNLRRDPRASLCVISDDFFGPWVQVDGDVEVVGRPEAVEVLVDYYRRISGEHPDWDAYRAAMEAEGRVALRLTITAAGPDRRG